MSARLPDAVVAAIRDDKILRIRVGTRPHRAIGIWAVVVEGRVFVRSWSVTRRGWYRALREEPVGLIQVEGREVPVRAVFTRSVRTKDAVGRAYLEKYDSPGSIRYARDLDRATSRATTTELVPRARISGSVRKAAPTRSREGRRRRGARRTPGGRVRTTRSGGDRRHRGR
jgi:hypothetical protein